MNRRNRGLSPVVVDLISGTAGNDVIDGKGGDDALSGMAGDDYIEGGVGSDTIQGGLGQDTINGGVGNDIIYGSSDMAIDKPASVGFTQPVNDYLYPQATGFNWTAGYYDTLANGVPSGHSNAPRNRLDGDQGNLIDGGVGETSLLRARAGTACRAVWETTTNGGLRHEEGNNDEALVVGSFTHDSGRQHECMRDGRDKLEGRSAAA